MKAVSAAKLIQSVVVKNLTYNTVLYVSAAKLIQSVVVKKETYNTVLYVSAAN